MFSKTTLPHWCKTFKTSFSWIIFHGGGGSSARSDGCIGETARLYHPLFARRGDIHACALFEFPLGLFKISQIYQLEFWSSEHYGYSITQLYNLVGHLEAPKVPKRYREEPEVADGLW